MAENWEKIARTYGYTDETAMWTDLYVTCSLSIEELHKRLNYGMHTIIRRLEACGIKRRKAGGPRFSPNQRLKLFHLDQRAVWSLTIKELAIACDVSTALISKYKSRHGGKFDGILYNMSDSRAGEVREAVPHAFSASAGEG